MKKKGLVLVLLIALLALFVGCSKDESGTSSASSAETAASADPVKVAYVTPGATGDNGFCDSVASGLERMKADFGVDYRIVECNNDASKYAEALEATFLWEPDVVFSDPYGFEELIKQYADDNPDVAVVILDMVLENNNKTAASYTFINEEGSFLAGVCAALVTKSDLEYANEDLKVGFVGGNDIPVIREFYYGFEQGAKYVDPNIEVLSIFCDGFFDPVKGKAAAKQLYAQGCDIIFQAAGRTGSGVLEAASETSSYAIGVDSNQNPLYPGHIVTSMVKDLGGAVYDMYALIENGTFEPGKHYEKGAGPSGVYLAIDSYSEDILTEEMLSTLDSVVEKIGSGEIVVDRYNQ